MKIENPNMTKIRKAANAHKKEANSAKLRADTSKAYQIKNRGHGSHMLRMWQQIP